MSDDPLLFALEDDGISLQAVLDLIPAHAELWGHYCGIPYSCHGYHGLKWQEFLAISRYFEVNDEHLIEDVILCHGLEKTVDFNRFLVDKMSTKARRKRGPPRRKSATNAYIYSRIKILTPRLGGVQNAAFCIVAKELNRSREAIVTAFYAGLKDDKLAELRTKKEILEAYLLYKK